MQGTRSVSNPLATVADLEAYLGREFDDPTSAELAIDIASDIVRSYVGHSITKILNDTVILDGTGTSILLLPAAPVNGIDLVEIDGDLLETTKYRWSKKGYILRTDGTTWPSTPGSIEVIYNHGYDTVPDAVLGVVLALAGRITDGSSGIKQETIGSYSVTYADPSPVLRANEQAGLDSFRVTV
jgi:hypothetical protein